MKRVLSLSLALIMIVSSLWCADFSAFADCSHTYKNGYCKSCNELDPSFDFTAVTAELNTPYDVEISNTSKYAVFSFTPEESGYYQFTRTSSSSISCGVYLASDGKVIKTVFTAGCFEVEAGKEYLLVLYQKTNDTVSNFTFSLEKHEHTISTTVSNPTCTRKGTTVTRCTVCDYYVSAVTPATGVHDYVNGRCRMCNKAQPDYVRPYRELEADKEYEIVQEKQGETTYFKFTPESDCYCQAVFERCTVYVYKNSQSVKLTNNVALFSAGEEYEIWVTPYSVGTTTFKLASHEHTYNSTVTPATCMADGSAVYTCTVCKYSYTDILPQDEDAHKFVNGKCLYCEAVDENYTDTAKAIQLGDNEKAPILESEYQLFSFTPETDGCYLFYTYLFSSKSTISAQYSAEVLYEGEPAGSYKSDGTYGCYCELEAGKEYILKVQNNLTKDAELQINVFKHTHYYRVYKTEGADCIHSGTATYRCAHCYHMYTDEYPATGVHAYANGVCIVCGDVDESYVKTVTPITENRHLQFDSTVTGNTTYFSFSPEADGNYVIITTSNFNDENNRKFPTTKVCDESGDEVASLSYGKELPDFYSYYSLKAGVTYEISVTGNCSQTGTVVVKRHTHTLVSDGNTPNCNAYVTETKSCSAIGCDYKEITEYEPTGLHEFVETVHAPTCSMFGYTEYTCKNCGTVYVYDYVPLDPQAHFFNQNGVCEYCDEYADESLENKITLGERQSFTVHGEDDEAMFTFTPEKDGYYFFRSDTAAYDPYVEVYDKDGEDLYDSDDINDDNYNFSFVGEFKGGEKYYFYFGCFYDNENDTSAQTVEFYSGEHEHNYVKSTISANCGRKGYERWSCACGDYYISAVTPKSDRAHNYFVYRNVQPTCVEDGYKVYRCALCLDTYTEVTAPATGVHTYVDGVCENCGALEEKYCHTGVIDPDAPFAFDSEDKFAQFDLEFTAEESGTYLFETLGKSDVSGAVTCGDKVLNSDYLGNGVASNCRVSFEAEQGKTYTISLYAENEKGVSLTASITRHEHTYKYLTIPATCGEAGAEIATCTACFEQSTEITAPTEQHSFENGVCTVCGTKEGETLDSAFELKADGAQTAKKGDGSVFFFTPVHSGEVTVYATGPYITTAAVYAVDENSEPGATEIASDSDSSGELMNFSMTFNVENGKTYYVITGENAGDYEVHLNCDKLVHSYTETVTEPTCTEGGYTTYTCECGDTYTADETEPLGHMPTTDKAVAATFKKSGKTAGSHCSRCGEIIKAQKTVAKLVSPTVNKLTAGKKQFTATWKKAPTVAGYEIQYATNAKFTKAKKIVVKKDKSTKTTVRKLTSKKKYFVRVRAYKTINGRKVYSVWSKAKSVKIK